MGGLAELCEIADAVEGGVVGVSMARRGGAVKQVRRGCGSSILGAIVHLVNRCLSNVEVSSAMASFPGLVYMARVRGSWWRLLAWRRMVEAPFSPRWVNEEWRSWWGVHPPLASLNNVEALS